MPESLIVDWLNENEQRAYPLKETANRTDGGFTLPDNVILDAALVYTTTQTSVRLLQVDTNTLNTVIFTLTGSQVFAVDLLGTFPQYVRLAGGSLLVIGEAVKDIPTGQTYNFTADFEDAVWVEWLSAWAGVNYVNFRKDTTDIIKTGEVELVEGFQVELVGGSQLLTMRVGRNYGEPLGCDTIGALPNDCDEIISFVNGAQSDENLKLALNAGDNVIIMEDPDNHRIYIGLVFQQKDICPVIYSHPVWA